MTNKWADVNGEHYDAERIAKWFFQVDDPRQKECEKLVEAALAKEARDAGFGSSQEVIAGLDSINAHNGPLGKLCFSIAALEPFQPNIPPSYRDGYTAAKNAALALVEAANEAARDAAKEPR